MVQPGTFDRVYAALRQRLLSGEVRPGERLEPAALSADFNASVTPVRDALHRLTGEKLVDAPRHEGFRAPLLTEATLRHLYAWHLDILLIALSCQRARSGGVFPDRLPAPEAPAGELFAAIAAASGNPEHSVALGGVSARLEPYQCFADAFLSAIDDDTVAILSALRASDSKALRKSLTRYHRRRQRLVPELLAELNRDH